MNIFKYLIKNAKRDWNFGDICYYAKIYREIEIEEQIKEFMKSRPVKAFLSAIGLYTFPRDKYGYLLNN